MEIDELMSRFKIIPDSETMDHLDITEIISRVFCDSGIIGTKFYGAKFYRNGYLRRDLMGYLLRHKYMGLLKPLKPFLNFEIPDDENDESKKLIKQIKTELGYSRGQYLVVRDKFSNEILGFVVLDIHDYQGDTLRYFDNKSKYMTIITDIIVTEGMTLSKNSKIQIICNDLLNENEKLSDEIKSNLSAISTLLSNAYKADENDIVIDIGARGVICNVIKKGKNSNENI